MSKIVFMENPLMDISKELKDDSLLVKYGLSHGLASLATVD
jgi:hypothetical protein